MKINVAYIIPSLEVGGSEKKVIDLASGLNKDIFNPIIITITKNGPLLQVAEKTNIPVFCVRKKGKFDVFVVGRIKRILKRNKIDLVQVFTSTGKLWGRLAAIRAKTKVIISSEESLYRNSKIDKFLERKFIRKTHLVIGNSLATTYYASRAVERTSIYKTIYNGIDLEPFINAKPLGIIPKEDDEKIIMCVARFDVRKRIDLLISAIYDIQYLMKVKLVLVGSGEQEKDLRTYVTELKLDDKVIFLGTRNDVPNLLKEADVFVLASEEEGFGNVIVEAMAAKVCVVASSAGGIPEIIEKDKTGLIFRVGDFDTLKYNLVRVLEDKELRERLVEEAFKNVHKFSKERMLAEYEKVYLELIERRNKK